MPSGIKMPNAASCPPRCNSGRKKSTYLKNDKFNTANSTPAASHLRRTACALPCDKPAAISVTPSENTNTATAKPQCKCHSQPKPANSNSQFCQRGCLANSQ